MAVSEQVTTIGLLLGGLSILATVVGVLWRGIVKSNQQTEARLLAADTVAQERFIRIEKKLDECEKDRLDLWKRMAEIAQTGIGR